MEDEGFSRQQSGQGDSEHARHQLHRTLSDTSQWSSTSAAHFSPISPLATSITPHSRDFGHATTASPMNGGDSVLWNQASQQYGPLSSQRYSQAYSRSDLPSLTTATPFQHLGYANQYGTIAEQTSHSNATTSLEGRGTNGHHPYGQYQQGAYNPQSSHYLHRSTSALPSQRDPFHAPHLGIYSMPVINDNSQAASPRTIFQDFEARLVPVLRELRADRLHLAAAPLMDVTKWLLGSAVGFKLHEDNQAQDPMRLKMWRDFNHTWLVFMQKQKDLTLAEINGTRPATATSRRVTSHTLDEFWRTLSQYCNPLDDLGLVDWERGVWEGQIADVIRECLQLVIPIDGDPKASSPSPTQAPYSSSSTPTYGAIYENHHNSARG